MEAADYNSRARRHRDYSLMAAFFWCWKREHRHHGRELRRWRGYVSHKPMYVEVDTGPGELLTIRVLRLHAYRIDRAPHMQMERGTYRGRSRARCAPTMRPALASSDQAAESFAAEKWVLSSPHDLPSQGADVELLGQVPAQPSCDPVIDEVVSGAEPELPDGFKCCRACIVASAVSAITLLVLLIVKSLMMPMVAAQGGMLPLPPAPMWPPPQPTYLPHHDAAPPARKATTPLPVRPLPPRSHDAAPPGSPMATAPLPLRPSSPPPSASSASSPPPPHPVQPPTSPLICSQWCRSHPGIWIRKCADFRECLGCHECRTPPPQGPAPRAPPSPPSTPPVPSAPPSPLRPPSAPRFPAIHWFRSQASDVAADFAVLAPNGKRLQESACAVVGGGHGLANGHYGAEIDQADVVIRVNRLPPSQGNLADGVPIEAH